MKINKSLPLNVKALFFVSIFFVLLFFCGLCFMTTQQEYHPLAGLRVDFCQSFLKGVFKLIV